MQPFKPTHRITIKRTQSGLAETIEVMAPNFDGSPLSANGPLYTRQEWRTHTSADWEVNIEGELTYRGEPGGPYLHTEYTFSPIAEPF